MGRVERRMYKQQRKRKWLLLLILTVGIMILLVKRLPDDFISEYIPKPTETSSASSFDQTIEKREVTLAQDVWYAIQTGIFSTEDAARQKADAYAERGAPGTVIQDGAKWRVFIACYESEADAASVRTRLSTNQHVDTYLYPWTAPEVRLRLTGKAGQLDAVEAGFNLLNTAANTLRDAAIDLDAAQLTREDAAATVRALDDAIALWEETITKRFGKSVPPLLQSMLNITEGWNERREAVLKADNVTELSAALKAQAMGFFDEMIAWRNSLLTQ